MQCKNHPQLAAKDRCAGCAEPFCENCLVSVHGRSYCAACKVMALRSREPAVVETRTKVCPEAREALMLAVVATRCCCWCSSWSSPGNKGLPERAIRRGQVRFAA